MKLISQLTKDIELRDWKPPAWVKEFYIHVHTVDDLPLENILREVQDEVLFVSVSHEMVNRFKYEIVQRTVKNGVKMTVRILDPNSKHLPNKQSNFGRSVDDLRSVIVAELKRLCEQKNKLKKHGINLTVETYDDSLNHSYILVDPQSKNPWIKTERHSPQDPELRESKLAYKLDNPSFYRRNVRILQNIKNVKKYNCT